ncbi:MAG: NAD(P)H-dependent oxidoreductase [Actinobacteria bacterium]|nr:MAG: NAD(P)H-dependent oxidoreductase [Actinomycetota bacterium]
MDGRGPEPRGRGGRRRRHARRHGARLRGPRRRARAGRLHRLAASRPAVRIVGLGGSLARISRSRAALQAALEGAERAGAETELLDIRRCTRERSPARSRTHSTGCTCWAIEIRPTSTTR